MSLDPGRILLVHPLGYGGNGKAARDISRRANIMPPLGLASIAAYLEANGVKTDMVDYFARPDSDRMVLDYVRQHRPAAVGFSCTTSSFLDGARIAAMVKAECPQVRTVFGGVHVSALREKVLEDYAAVDVVAAGEGEATMLRLMQGGLGEPWSVPGCMARGASGDIRASVERPAPMDLDALPFPAYEKLEGFPDDYALPIFNYPKAPSTSCLSSRGCPYSCSYCDRSVFGRSYRFNSAQYLYEHMRYLRQRFGIRHVTFYDDQFTFHRERVVKLTDMLVSRPLGMTFNCAVRANHVDEELMQRLAAAGCWMVSLGIESGSQELLARQNRNIPLQRVRDVVAACKRSGLRVKGLLMMGLPGETEESIALTQEFFLSLPLDDLNLTKFTPFPGAPVHEEIVSAKGALGSFDEDWERMDCMHFLFVPKGFSLARLEELHREFYKAHFSRPRVLWDYVTMMWRSPDSWRRFARNAGMFVRFAFRGDRYGGTS